MLDIYGLPTLKGRFFKAFKRYGRNARLAHFNRSAVKLNNYGAAPQWLWGIETYGLAPFQAARLTTKAANASGVKARGRCTTTAILLLYKPEQHPCIAAPLKTITAFFNFWRTHPEQHAAIRVSWPYYWRTHAKSIQWRQVTGPVAAAFASMLQSGWRPISPDRVYDPNGTLWLVGGNRSFLTFKNAFIEFASNQLWAKAAKVIWGKGLQNGPDLYITKQRYWKFAAEPEHAGWVGMFATTLANATWTNVRRYMKGLSDTALCPRCGLCWESMKHRLWKCRCNEQLDIPAVRDTQYLIARADYESFDFQCFWYRGLPPKEWYKLPSTDFEPTFSAWGSLQGFITDGKFGTDGSGGDHTANPRLRRCSWGLVHYVITECGRFLQCGAAWGPAPGKQSVPRAELWALIAAAFVSTPGSSPHVTLDCEPVYRGF